MTDPSQIPQISGLYSQLQSARTQEEAILAQLYPVAQQRKSLQDAYQVAFEIYGYNNTGLQNVMSSWLTSIGWVAPTGPTGATGVSSSSLSSTGSTGPTGATGVSSHLSSTGASGPTGV